MMELKARLITIQKMAEEVRIVLYKWEAFDNERTKTLKKHEYRQLRMESQ